MSRPWGVDHMTGWHPRVAPSASFAGGGVLILPGQTVEIPIVSTETVYLTTEKTLSAQFEIVYQS